VAISNNLCSNNICNSKTPNCLEKPQSIRALVSMAQQQRELVKEPHLVADLIILSEIPMKP
jgi:hypothetical protein